MESMHLKMIKISFFCFLKVVFCYFELYILLVFLFPKILAAWYQYFMIMMEWIVEEMYNIIFIPNNIYDTFSHRYRKLRY